MTQSISLTAISQAKYDFGNSSNVSLDYELALNESIVATHNYQTTPSYNSQTHTDSCRKAIYYQAYVIHYKFLMLG